MEIKSKKVVWDLFGGGNNSVAKALSPINYEIYTFDVVPNDLNTYHSPNYHYFNLDLSCGLMINNQKHLVNGYDNIIDLFKSLNIPSPDIIVASPLCQSFSNVLSLVGGGTCFWKKTNRYGTIEDGTKLIERSIDEFEELKGNGFTKKLKADKQLFIKRLGQKCIENTVELIKYFKPKYWYIENPTSSLIWFYIVNNLDLNGYLNKTALGHYGFLIAKYATFLSNVDLELDNSKYEPKFKKVIFQNKEVYLLDEYSLKDLERYYDGSLNNFVYASKGIAYFDKHEKKLISKGYYTYFSEIPKEEYDKRYKDAMLLLKKGSSGDKRDIKFDKKTNKYYKRYYIQTGYSFNDKSHVSLKKTSLTLGTLSKKKYKQPEGLTTIQLNEANESTHLPSKLIQTIFSKFQ